MKERAWTITIRMQYSFYVPSGECRVQCLITFHCETGRVTYTLCAMLESESHLFLCECVIIDTPAVYDC